MALAVSLVAGLAAGGVAQAAKRVPVRIVSPAGGERAYGDLTVRVRTASRAPRLRVTMYGRGRRLRDVTARFKRVGAHRFAGRLRMGRQLRVGRNHIYAGTRAGRRGAAERHVLIARRVRRPLIVRRHEQGRNERPPLEVTVRGRGSILRARLNGVRARRSFMRTGEGRWSAQLSRKDGLRFGRNRLAVRVFDTRGRYQRAVRTVRVRRDRPLVDAGRDGRVRARRSIRLDGRLSRPGRKALGLRLSWRIVREPRGSHARLVGAHGRRPRLVTDLAGRYRIALRARHARSAPAATTAATAATTVNPQVTDVVDVTAAPDLPPSGAPLQTMVMQGGSVGISVGEQSAGTFHAMAAGAVIQLLAIDRETLAVDKDKSYYPGEEEVLQSDVYSLTADDIVVLSGGGRPYVLPARAEEAIGQIGATFDGESRVGVLSALYTGDWSVVGIPGVPQGQAYQLIGLRQSSDRPAGAMDGRLRLGTDGTHYAFSWAPEYHTFDTSQSRTAASNAIAVDGYPYASDNLPVGADGYQLLWFDADTLAGRDMETFNADVYDRMQPYGMWGLRAELQVIAADPKPALLLINTIGDVRTPFYTAEAGRPSSSCTGYDNCPTRGSDGNDSRGEPLARITTLLQEFGANPYVYVMAGSSHPGDPGMSGGYSLVGVTGLEPLKGPNAAAELSTRMWKDQPIARLRGVLKRSRQGVLMAGSTGSPGATDDPTLLEPSLQRILGQPDQPFVPFSTPGEKAAVAYIAGQLDLKPDSTYGIRGLYWLTPTVKWDDKAIALKSLAACSANCPAGFNPADFTAVKNELVTEFTDVDAVRNALTGSDDNGGIYQILNNTFLSQGSLGFTSIAENIRKSYDPPLSATEGPNAFGIVEGVLGLTGAIGGFVPGAEAFTAVAELGAAMADVGEESIAEGGGASPIDPYGFRSTTADLATDLLNAYNSALAAIDDARDLIVSDAGRLKAAAALAQAAAADGGWLLGNEQRKQLTTSLQQTMQQYMWLTMAQPVFATYECAIEDANTMTTRKNYNPDAVLQTNINVPQLQSPDTRYLASWWNLYPTTVMLGQRNRFGWPSLVSETITNTLFNAPVSGGLGLRPEYFLASANALDTDESDRTYLSRPLKPTSSGLLHKNMNMWHDAEKAYPIASRAIWSMYTPSCGYGQRQRWSAPDPNAPDDRDPAKSSDSHWDPGTNPYRNP